MSCIFAQVMRFRGGTTFKTAWLTCGIPHPKRKMNRKLLSLYGPSSLKLDYITYSKRQTFQFCMTTMNVLLAKDWPKKSFKKKNQLFILKFLRKNFFYSDQVILSIIWVIWNVTPDSKKQDIEICWTNSKWSESRVLLKLVFCSWTS